MLYSNQKIKIQNKTAFQVNITRARKYFDEGRTIFIHPCNLRLNNAWQNPFEIKKDPSNELEFDRIVNEFRYHNCDNERGLRPIFFVKSKSK